MNEIEVYFKKFKTVILIVVLTLIVFGYIVSKIVPVVTDIYKMSQDYKTAVTTLADKERTLKNLQEKTAKAEAENQNTIKAVYKPIEQGMDTESIIANEFAEILTLIRGNAIKTRSIKYEYDPKDDNFVKNVPDKYHVAKLDIEMIGTYKDFEGFLKEFERAGLKDQVIIKAADEEIDLDIAHIDSEYKIGYELTRELLEEQRDVTAIVGLNDMIAFGILDALQEAKLKVPGDVSVMGCDNTLFASMHKMSLTTIEHFVIFKGRDACDIIMKKIDSRREKYTEVEPISTYHVEYEPKLIIRGTTSYPKSRKKKN